MEDEQSTREANKICGVCGDKALGYNFNAVSCESCKAFFRRNALKNKDFRCPFSEDCKVTPVTRRFCQKCRLDKCFSIGMRKEYIMTEEDKVLKRRKIEQNRAKKRSTTDKQKLIRMKCELLDENNYDDTSLSVASTVSETYFWESDRKYRDLDDNRQTTIESMSPVTAESVPSPSSPDSRDIIGSKTLEMLTDSSNTSNNHGFQINNNNNNTSIDDKLLNSKNSVKELKNDGIKIYQESLSDSTSNDSFSSHSITIKSSKKIDAKCKKSMKICSKSSSELINKLQSPKFIDKLMKNSSLVVKIFQDKNVLMKLLDNPEIAELINDDDDDENNELKSLVNNGIPEDMIHDISTNNNTDNENPILTNLIDKNSRDDDHDNSSEKANLSGNNYDNTTDYIAIDGIQDVQSISIAANSIESILSEAIKFEFSAYSSLANNQSGRELNDAERAKLNELIVANKALLAPLDDDITNLIGEECKFKSNFGCSDPALLDVINLTAIAIRRLIKMVKKISAFKNMCQDDQLALLKGGCTEMLILRSALTYDPDKDIWQIPHSQENMSKIRVDVLKEAKGNLYAEHAKFIRTFDSKWRDENIILILCAIALFTPNRQRVVHTDVIKLEQNSYYYLLRRYLESVYPGCEAKSTFLKLIQKMSELHKLNNEVVGVYLNVNPSNVEPLLIEIFDLKH